MGKILDYTIVELIAETRTATIFRASRAGDRNTVIIKLIKLGYPTASEIARFNQECDSIKKAAVSGIAKIHDFFKYNDSFAVVQEDFDGISIKALIEKKKSLFILSHF